MPTPGPSSFPAVYWAEEAGPRWVRDRARHDAELAPMLDALLAAAAPRPGERVVDVGCGAGTSTLAVAELVGPAGQVIGLDVSPPLIAELDRRIAAGGTSTVSTVCADAEHAVLPGPFDLLVSRMGVMFFLDQPAAWRNLHAAMAPGGRAAVVVWQEQSANPWMSVPATAALQVSPPDAPPPRPGEPGPHGLADRALTTSWLTTAGWQDVAFTGVRPLIELGSDLDNAVEQVSALASVGGAIERVGAELVVPAVRAALAPYVDTDGAVRMGSAAWVITARA